MNYVFFDIECANNFEGTAKICEFSYVVTDSKFEIKEENTLYINPNDKFDVEGFKIAGIKFSEPYEFYYKQPTFPNFYKQIATLLNRKNHVAIGHGVENDLKFIADECRRYELKPINVVAYDTKELAKSLLNRENEIGLNALYNEFCGSTVFSEQLHRSIDDAKMTMSLGKFFQDYCQIALQNVILENSLCQIELYLGRIVKAGTPIMGYSVSNKTKGKNELIFNNFVKYEFGRECDKEYYLPNSFISENFRQTMIIMDAMRKKGLKLRRNLRLSSIYVCIEDELDREVKNERIDFESFLDLLELKMEDLENVSEEKLNDIVGNMKVNKNWYESYKKTHSVFYKIEDYIDEKRFECSVDFPVIEYRVKITLQKENEKKEFERKLFYDYVMDDYFSYHPYRVNRAANSYLDQSFYKKASKKARKRLVEGVIKAHEIKGEIKNIEVVTEHQYITSYKFFGEFDGDKIKFEFPASIYANQDFKNAKKNTKDNFKIEIKKSIEQLYDEKTLAKALCNMSKMKFRYKDKEFIEPKITNKKIISGDSVLLAKEYYLQKDKLTDEYLPSLIDFSNDLFKKKITLPVLVIRKK